MPVRGLALKCGFVLLLVASSDHAFGAPVDFANDVQPILKKHCVSCHGADRQESHYRLDLRASALSTADFGVAPIVSGESGSSSLLRYVSGNDEDGILMPPEDEGERLNESQIEILKRWIDEGAVWPDEFAGDAADARIDHWSFQPLSAPPVPRVDSAWVQNAVDAWILHQLRHSGLAPSSQASRRTLIRRVYLLMLGLLPSPSEVARFVEDPAADAYQRMVDRVLASPLYGERWGRHWLDVIRFAETNGFETNRERPSAYHFRDYVIRSMNADKPYDRFVKEQICGDALQADVGTGFLVAGAYDIVKSPDINLTLMQRQDELADIVNATGTTFLGLSLGCARCHTHKFDPIPQRDYYAVQAVFSGVDHGERELNSPETESTRRQLQVMRGDANGLREILEQYYAKARQAAENQHPDHHQRPAVNSRSNQEQFQDTTARSLRFTIRATQGAEPCIDELEVFDIDGINVALAKYGTISHASGTLPNYEIHQLKHINDGLYGNSRSWISDTPGSGWVELTFPEPVTINRVIWGRDRDGNYSDRLAVDYVIEVQDDSKSWRAVASSADRAAYRGSLDDKARLSLLNETDQQAAKQLIADLGQLEREISQLAESVDKAWIGTFRQPEPTHRLYRGDPLAKREQVSPDGLTYFGSLGMKLDEPEQSRRVRFAEWLTAAETPLTSRVIVNRLWHYHFGTGIVSTPNDLGVNGDRPTHPELLDWLATELIRSDWSLKHIHRLILLSSSFQQDSRPRADGMAVDGGSRLLWRFPPRRLEAEAIRDNILSVAGSLDLSMGGPGFSVFQVELENVRHYFPRDSWGPDQWRRMVYMTKVRQEQDAVFGNFDCPDGNSTVPKRSRSTTPLQSLNLFNSTFVLQQSQLLATRLRKEAGEDIAAQVQLAFQLTASRMPDATEAELSAELVREHGLASFCRAMLNSNEFLFVF